MAKTSCSLSPLTSLLGRHQSTEPFLPGLDAALVDQSAQECLQLLIRPFQILQRSTHLTGIELGRQRHDMALFWARIADQITENRAGQGHRQTGHQIEALDTRLKAIEQIIRHGLDVIARGRDA